MSESHKCEICCEDYNTSSHRPKILPCLHTFCKHCVTELCNEDKARCPICQHEITKLDQSGITTNFQLLEIIDTTEEQTIHTDKEESESLTPTNEDLLQPLISKFEIVSETSSKIRESLTNHRTALLTSCEEAVKQMESEFDELIHLLVRRKKLLKQQIMSQCENKIGEIDDDLEMVTLNSMRLDSLQRHTMLLLSEEIDVREETQIEPSLSVEELNRRTHVARGIESEIVELEEPLKAISTDMGCSFKYESRLESDNLTKLIRNHGKFSVG